MAVQLAVVQVMNEGSERGGVVEEGMAETGGNLGCSSVVIGQLLNSSGLLLSEFAA